MIIYQNELFGVHLLPRAHGSAVYRAILPSAISTSILLIAVYGFDQPDPNIIANPYAIGVFIAFFTYLVTFRANFAYGRYWEGATSVHQMLSKWLDVGMNIAAYHYQCLQYQKVRPPTFGKNTTIRNLTRERERQEQMSHEEMKAKLLEQEEEERKQNMVDERNRFVIWRERQRRRRRQRSLDRLSRKIQVGKSIATTAGPRVNYHFPVPAPSQSLHYRQGQRRHRRGETRISQKFDKSLLELVTQEQAYEGGVETPSLFLQEAAHLLSLLSAVAMSTLRTDSMEEDPPLVEHIPGRPWPPVDPDTLSAEIRKDFNESSRFLTAFRFLFGIQGRSPRHVFLYNAARPFRVLGGVSDAEMDQLSAARGPEAKVAMCSKWLQEFITREYMAGSTGGVAPPIISRLYQFVSDGTIGYNQSRKVSQIPFPFAHTQLTTIFIGVCVFVFPLLYYSYVNNLAFACILNFVTVMCFVGVHEVARELEQPYRNVPNDLPLTTFQAQFNEALIAMYAGFHPDSWSVEEQVTSTPTITNGAEESAAASEGGENEDTTRNRTESHDTVDLLAFFRKEKEEKQANETQETTPPGVASPAALLKKAAAPFLAAAHTNDTALQDSITSVVTVDDEKPKSILKGIDDSKFIKSGDEGKKKGEKGS